MQLTTFDLLCMSLHYARARPHVRLQRDRPPTAVRGGDIRGEATYSLAVDTIMLASSTDG
jgi:hypothetical protein